MNADGASAVEREAELLAEALGRAWGHQTDSAPETGSPDDSRAAPVRWVQEHGPELLRSLADVTALVSDGLRVLADHVEESGGAGHADAGADEQPEQWGTGEPQTQDGRVQERWVQERYEEQA